MPYDARGFVFPLHRCPACILSRGGWQRLTFSSHPVVPTHKERFLFSVLASASLGLSPGLAGENRLRPPQAPGSTCRVASSQRMHRITATWEQTKGFGRGQWVQAAARFRSACKVDIITVCRRAPKHQCPSLKCPSSLSPPIVFECVWV